MKKILGVLMVLGLMFSFTNITRATGVDNSGDIPTKVSFNRTLSVGLKGEDIKYLQQILTVQGFLVGSKVDGSFGPKTKLAVIAFQKAHNLFADGKFGAKSRIEFFKIVEGENKLASCPAIMVSGGAYPGSVPVSVTQYMQVLSPNGGETYHVGDTVNITWKNCFTSVQSPLTIGISLIDFNASSGHQAIPIGNAVQIANGSYSFTIPATIVAYGATISMNGSNYKIGIMDGMVGANGGHGDTSDASFTILP